MNDEILPPRRLNGLIIAIVIVGAMAILLALAIRPDPSLQKGKPFPPIEVAGWINGPGPTADDLKGQIFVVDAWAFWCGPCRAAVPELLKLQKKYAKRGVKFIGLTREGQNEKEIEESQKYVRSLKIPWPNGYGAQKPLLELKVEGIPQLWVVGRDNRIVFQEIGWSGNSANEIDQVLEKVLAEQPEPKNE